MYTCPECKTRIVIHADGSAACSCQFVNPSRAFPKAWKDASIDLAAIRSAMRQEVRLITPYKGGRTKRAPEARLTPLDFEKLTTLLTKSDKSFADWLTEHINKDSNRS